MNNKASNPAAAMAAFISGILAIPAVVFVNAVVGIALLAAPVFLILAAG